MGKVWIGVGVGRDHHHVSAVDDAGPVLFSEQVPNRQPELTAVVAWLGQGRRRSQLCWGMDLRPGPAALMLTTLLGMRCPGFDGGYGSCFPSSSPAA